MSYSLFESIIPTFLQLLNANADVLAKGRAHCEANGTSPDDLVDVRLCEDMLPLVFQVNSVRHHSAGAIEGVRRGEFAPPPPLDSPDYAALEALVKDAIDVVSAATPDEVNGFIGGDVVFKLGAREIPFTAENFLSSFSIPNFTFHTTTAYDLLRINGVPLGKRDYLGQMRIKV